VQHFLAQVVEFEHTWSPFGPTAVAGDDLFTIEGGNHVAARSFAFGA
jgi:hypothetical protein